MPVLYVYTYVCMHVHVCTVYLYCVPIQHIRIIVFIVSAREMAEEGERLTNTPNLLHKVKDTFHSSIDASSVVQLMVEKKLMKKKEKKFLDTSDEATKSSYLYSEFTRSDRRFILKSQEFINIIKETDHEKNVIFANHLQRLLDESEKHFVKTQCTCVCMYCVNVRDMCVHVLPLYHTWCIDMSGNIVLTLHCLF